MSRTGSDMFYASIALLIAVAAGSALFALRSRLRRSPSVEMPALPDDVEAYIHERETAVAGIRPGLHKQIVWVSPEKARTRYSIVYIHGFSASPGELRPVPDRVAAALQANLFYTRLNGHAVDGAALGKAQLDDWLDDVAEAIGIGEKLGEEVIVMATSTGAALATWALAQPRLSRQIGAAVLFSPNYGLKARGAFLLRAPFARQIVHLVLGRSRGVEATTDAHSLNWTMHYPTDALLPMAASIGLANAVDFASITVPALVFYSPADQTVDPARIVRNAGKWGVPHQLVAITHPDDPACHVLAGDALSPSTTGDVVARIDSWLRTQLDLPA